MSRDYDREADWAAPGVPLPGLADELAAIGRTVDLLQSRLASMTASSTTAVAWGEALVAMTVLQARVAATVAIIAAHADVARVGEDSGARSSADWWARASRVTKAEAVAVTRLGHELQAAFHHPLATAYGAGEVLTDQTRVIVRALADLPPTTDPQVRAKAQVVLTSEAAHHDAKALRILGRRVLDVVDPSHGDAHEAKLLAREEAAAQASSYFMMADDGQGSCHGRFRVPTLHGAILRKALTTIGCNSARAGQVSDPAHDDGASSCGVPPIGRRRLTPEVMGDAFTQLLERFPAEGLPTAGGVNATVVVTMDYSTLIGGLKAAHLDTGQPLSPGEARKLACEAGIIPAVLGGRSEVLDLGRSKRFHSKAQRIALGIRDRGCTVEGCDVPTAGCHAHHEVAWSQGGPTTVKDGRLLCPRHHTLIHHPDYAAHRQTNGTIILTRRRRQ